MHKNICRDFTTKKELFCKIDLVESPEASKSLPSSPRVHTLTPLDQGLCLHLNWRNITIIVIPIVNMNIYITVILTVNIIVILTFNISSLEPAIPAITFYQTSKLSILGHRHIFYACKKYTKKCRNSLQNSQNRSKCAKISR